MKELENKLNENAKVIEERNNEYLNALNEEQEKWQQVLKNIEDGESKVAEVVKSLPVVGVGDSVLLGAINGLYSVFPNGYFDGKVSRSMAGGEDVIIDLKNKGKLSNVIILALANNSDFFTWRIDELMAEIGDRQVYWVDAVLADDPQFNEKFVEYSKKFPNVHIVNWVETSKTHPEYFYADGIHLKSDGITAYANTIYEAIYNDYLEEYRNKNKDVLEKYEEEKNNKIVFYGNDVLTNSFSYINEKFEKAVFNAKSDYTFGKLYDELKEKVEAKTLQHKIVFIFDSELKISTEEYQKIITMCSEYKIYICNLTDEKISFEENNVNIIDFYSEIKENKDYLMADKLHLTEKGNKALAEIIYECMTN